MAQAFLYSHFRADPFFNMGFDEWMLRQVRVHPDHVLMRVYTWLPGAITIGVHQTVDRAVDIEKLGSTQVIRRITGGRAIYHDPSELTYSVAFNLRGCSTVWSCDAGSAYNRLAEMLGDFAARCGVVTEMVRRSSTSNAKPAYFHTAPCFASRARYELVTGQRKVVASAQRRIGDQILQHGSVKVNGLVNHPALPQIDGASVDSIPPLSAAQFDSLVSHFMSACVAHLFSDIVRPCDNSGDSVIAEFVDFTRKNPMARRDHVKQSAVGVSL